MKRLCCPTDLHSYTNIQILLKKPWTMILKNSCSNCSFTSFPVSPPSCIIPVQHSNCIKNQLLCSSVTAQVRFTVSIYLWDLRHAFSEYCCEDISKSKNLSFLSKATAQNELLFEISYTVIKLQMHTALEYLVQTHTLTDEHTFLTPCSVPGVYNTRKSCIAGPFRTRRRGGQGARS